MKKIIFVSLILMLVTGCGLSNNGNILKRITNNIDKSNSYYLEGTMEIINNEDAYTYDVKVSYKKDNYYKVELTNTSNDHEQVILRNEDGVYVVTPNLNKSFKFQSDWPNNNSQVYLLDSIISDVNNDENYTVNENNSGYILTSKVNYPNNASLVKQNVYVDNNSNITKVEVVDTNEKVQIKMEFSKIDLNHKFDDDYFKLNQIISIKPDDDKKDTEKGNNEVKENDNSDTTNNSSSSNEDTNEEVNNNRDDNTTNNNEANNSGNTTEEDSDNNNSKTKETVTIDDIIYPMYLPDNTYLTNKEVVDTNNGKRLILNFDGDNSFVLIEETSSYNEDNLILPVSGEIDFVSDVLAVVGDSSITWTSAGIDYYMASSNLDSSELLQIARSISSLPVSK